MVWGVGLRVLGLGFRAQGFGSRHSSTTLSTPLAPHVAASQEE